MLRVLMAFLLFPLPSYAQVRVVADAVAPGLNSSAAVLQSQPLTLAFPAAPSLSALTAPPSVLVAASLPVPAAATVAAKPAAAAPLPSLTGLSALTADFTAHPPKSSGDALSAGRGLEDAMLGAASAPTDGMSETPVEAAAAPLSARRRLLGRASAALGDAKSLFIGDAEIRPFIRAHRRQFWVSSSLLVSNGVVGVFIAKTLGHFTDLAVAGHHVTGSGAAMILATTAVLSLKVSEIFLNWTILLSKRATAGIVAEIRTHLVRRLSALSMGYYGKNSAQAIAPRVVDDVNRLITRNWDIPIQMPYVLVRGALSLGMLAVLDWRVALVVAPAAYIFSRIATKFGKKFQKIAVSRQKENALVTAQLGELLSMLEVHKVFGSEAAAGASLEASIGRLAELNREELSVKASNGAVISMVGFVLVEFLTFGGSWLLFMMGWPSIGTIAAMQAYMGGVMFAISTVAANRTASREAIGSTQWVLNLLETRPEIADAPNAVDPGRIRGEIEFKDVHFGYEGDNAILNGVSFKTHPGQTVAFVGGTGSGKSTILRLLTRLYDPTSGSVTIDGHDVRGLKLAGLKRHMAIVPQDSALFGGTIRANLLAVEPGASEEALIASLRAANANFVFDAKAFPLGLDTQVGDRGASMSGGQRQRVAIARAILRNPDLLILDEATSALDNESELAVQDALKKLKHGRTTFVVAHRLTTIQDADVIHVLDQGVIVESGTHAELLAMRGKYYRLWTAKDAPR
jgi:subfamily B ATP-binding cassette protein MsbA